jgi:predicted alpha/beta superfamily hydrolase
MALCVLVITGCGSAEEAQELSPIRADTSAGVKPFVLGEVRALHSAVLGQDRTLNVYLPEGYSPDSAATYPVIYVLDGSANEDFPHIAGLAQYMNMYDLLPKSIVVGIANVDREQDFTFPTRNDSDRAWVSDSGGSARFIRFIAEEAQPFVRAHYKTNGKRTIIGQSLGGLLATEILFKRPELFDDYILVSPSVWWDTGSLADSADAWTKAHAMEPKRVFIAMASDDDMMRKEVDKMTAAFQANARPPLRWTYVEFPEETHATILHRAVYRAFEWMGRR